MEQFLKNELKKLLITIIKIISILFFLFSTYNVYLTLCAQLLLKNHLAALKQKIIQEDLIITNIQVKLKFVGDMSFLEFDPVLRQSRQAAIDSLSGSLARSYLERDRLLSEVQFSSEQIQGSAQAFLENPIVEGVIAVLSGGGGGF